MRVEQLGTPVLTCVGLVEPVIICPDTGAARRLVTLLREEVGLPSTTPPPEPPLPIPQGKHALPSLPSAKA